MPHWLRVLLNIARRRIYAHQWQESLPTHVAEATGSELKIPVPETATGEECEEIIRCLLEARRILNEQSDAMINLLTAQKEQYDLELARWRKQRDRLTTGHPGQDQP